MPFSDRWEDDVVDLQLASGSELSRRVACLTAPESPRHSMPGAFPFAISKIVYSRPNAAHSADSSIVLPWSPGLPTGAFQLYVGLSPTELSAEVRAVWTPLSSASNAFGLNKLVTPSQPRGIRSDPRKGAAPFAR